MDLRVLGDNTPMNKGDGCQVLTLDLSKKPGDDGYCPYFEVTNTTTKLLRGFTKYTYKYNGGSTFTLSGNLEGGDTLDGGEDIQDVRSVSAYYWKHENDGPKTALLLEVAIKNLPGTKYYAKDNSRRNNDWVKQQLNGKTLEQVLDDLNCLFNQAVTMDISHSNSTNHAGNSGEKYCCSYHSPDTERVNVTPMPINVNGSHHVYYYRHSIKDYALKLESIKFYLNGDGLKENRKRITSSRLNLPMNGPVDVYAFYCKDNDPVLIYVDANRSNRKFQANTGWYRKSSKGYDNIWTWIPTRLNDINPDTFDVLNCKQWKKLNKVLGYGDFQECPKDTYQELQQNSETSQDTSAPEVTEAQPPAAAKREVPYESPETFPWNETIFGTLATVVSGSVGLAGYHLYKNSRDPWVRQI